MYSLIYKLLVKKEKIKQLYFTFYTHMVMNRMFVI